MSSSRAYYLSHVLLRNTIFENWETFSEKLDKGPEFMKKYLSELWHSIDGKYFKEGVIITDINRKITADDFNITFRNINGRMTFFFIFPDPDSFSAQAKSVALVLSEEELRYITMEIWTEKEIPHQYTLGEWKIQEGKFMHFNYGYIPRATVECFATFVEKLLSEQNS